MELLRVSGGILRFWDCHGRVHLGFLFRATEPRDRTKGKGDGQECPSCRKPAGGLRPFGFAQANLCREKPRRLSLHALFLCFLWKSCQQGKD
jgi:hypothetical protein